MKKITFILAALFLTLANGGLFAQKLLEGVVLEDTREGKLLPLPGATVYWLEMPESPVWTDSSGHFRIALPAGRAAEGPGRLIVRYPGYTPDTLTDFSKTGLRIILASDKGKTLKEVSVEGRAAATFLSADVVGSQVMTSRELTRAACCNLAESFETNPAVEVTWSDAVSGARQIQMLGLSGLYTQMTQENLPAMRGLMAGYGLGFTPGPWIESIQVVKGVGSVANGYESMTGQINVELKKPDGPPRSRELFFGNAFVNSMGRYEINAGSGQKAGAGFSHQTLVHGNLQSHGPDRNGDGFMDIPTGDQINVLHRWAWNNGKGWSAQAGAQLMADNRLGGQHHKTHNYTTHSDEQYQINLKHTMLQGFAKLGYIFPEKKYKSLGFLASFTRYQTRQTMGPANGYGGDQYTGFAQVIYQSLIGTTDLRFRAGAGYRQEYFGETVRLPFGRQGTDTLRTSRLEQVPGAFGEFTWTPTEKLTLVAGLRADYHNLFGLWFTPRMHMRYSFSEDHILRFSGGKGRRVANPFAENPALLVSSRVWHTDGQADQNAYGPLFLRPEEAWNAGLSWTRGYSLLDRKGTLSADLFHTRFIRQVVMDLDRDPGSVFAGSSEGPSWSTSFQVQAEQEVARKLDVRMAYKWLDVWQTFGSRLLRRPFVSAHRFFITLAWENRKKWTFDLTWNLNGPRRLPSTAGNPQAYRFPDWSPSFAQIHAQVSKAWGKKWEAYLGIENALDRWQTRLINQPENPSGRYFDASLVWGPIPGRMVYGGVRLRIRSRN